LFERSPGRYTCHDLLRTYAADLSQEVDSDRERAAATHRILDHYLHTTYRAARVRHPLRQRFVLTEPRPGADPSAWPISGRRWPGPPRSTRSCWAGRADPADPVPGRQQAARRHPGAGSARQGCPDTGPLRRAGSHRAGVISP
jgi:hypothetical protein